MNIRDTFAQSNQFAKKSTRTRVFLENRILSAQMAGAFALLSVALAAGDWAIDSDNAGRALALRVVVAVLLSIAALVTWLSNSLIASYAATYIALALGEALFGILLQKLNGGILFGVGEYLYFLLGSAVLGMIYPLNLNLLGCVMLMALPSALGLFSEIEFPHILYASVIVPAGIITLLAHWRMRTLAVDNVRLRQEIESSALADPDTGLANMRGLEQAFRRLAKLGLAKPLQQFLLFIEIDGLDGIKKYHGEEFAHFLRAEFGELINLSFRNRDITASVDNEFVCVLLHVSRETAFDIAERFRLAVAAKEFDCASARTGRFSCTVSIGIVSADTKDQVRALLNHARIGADQAQGRGGNQCVCL
ncbi:MAG: GGDEF domain-containing protein [Candidatus Methylumidiphilus sp.]